MSRVEQNLRTCWSFSVIACPLGPGKLVMTMPQTWHSSPVAKFTGAALAVACSSLPEQAVSVKAARAASSQLNLLLFIGTTPFRYGGFGKVTGHPPAGWQTTAPGQSTGRWRRWADRHRD